MSNTLTIKRSKRTTTRKLPFLPRIGIVVEVAGCKLAYKQAPLSETLLNLYERGMTMANFIKVATEQFQEIDFPKFDSPKLSKKPVRKARPRA